MALLFIHQDGKCKWESRDTVGECGSKFSAKWISFAVFEKHKIEGSAHTWLSAQQSRMEAQIWKPLLCGCWNQRVDESMQRSCGEKGEITCKVANRNWASKARIKSLPLIERDTWRPSVSWAKNLLASSIYSHCFHTPSKFWSSTI